MPAPTASSDLPATNALVAATIAAQIGSTKRGQQTVLIEDTKRKSQRSKLLLGVASGIIGLISMYMVIKLLKYSCSNGEQSFICAINNFLNSLGNLFGTIADNYVLTMSAWMLDSILGIFR